MRAKISLLFYIGAALEMTWKKFYHQPPSQILDNYSGNHAGCMMFTEQETKQSLTRNLKGLNISEAAEHKEQRMALQLRI